MPTSYSLPVSAFALFKFGVRLRQCEIVHGEVLLAKSLPQRASRSLITSKLINELRGASYLLPIPQLGVRAEIGEKIEVFALRAESEITPPKRKPAIRPVSAVDCLIEITEFLRTCITHTEELAKHGSWLELGLILPAGRDSRLGPKWPEEERLIVIESELQLRRSVFLDPALLAGDTPPLSWDWIPPKYSIWRPLEVKLQELHRGMSTSIRLVARVENDLISKSVPTPEGPLTVDCSDSAAGKVTIGDRQFELSDFPAALFLLYVVNASPYIIRTSDLRQKHLALADCDRFGRLKELIPKCIANAVESKKGAGYRFAPELITMT